MKEQRITLLLGLLGIVASLTLLLAIAFSELSSNETLTTKINQIEESQAAELKPSPTTPNTLKRPDEVLKMIDNNFNSEPITQNLNEE